MTSRCGHWVAGFLYLALAACSGTVAPAKRERAPVASDIPAQHLQDAARFLAALPAQSGSSYRPLESTAAWQTYRANFDQAWAHVEESQLKPVAAFEKRVLAASNGDSHFLFYPFSGPDVLYMTRFFPGRRTYVMAGLERPGHIPSPGEYTEANVPRELANWSLALDSILHRSFFRTNEMSAQLYEEGTAPVMALLLTRAGYTVDGVQFGNLDASGKWRRADSAKKPRSVRLDFHTGDEAEQTLYYFSTDLSKAFDEGAPLPKFLDSIGRPEVLMKSASFLPHRTEFKGVREYILRSATRILQDDTGVPFLVLIDRGFNVRLFGEYSHPDKSFQYRYQPELEAAFAEPGRAEELGFAIGYGFRKRPSSMLLATPAK